MTFLWELLNRREPQHRWQVSCAAIGCFGKVSWAVLVNCKACSLPAEKTLQPAMWKYIIWQLALHRTVEELFIGSHTRASERERKILRKNRAPLFFLTVSCLSVDWYLFQKIPPEWLSACDLPPPYTQKPFPWSFTVLHSEPGWQWLPP